MSSFISKSKGKFAPKVKARPRPAAASEPPASAPAPPEALAPSLSPTALTKSAPPPPAIPTPASTPIEPIPTEPTPTGSTFTGSTPTPTATPIPAPPTPPPTAPPTQKQPTAIPRPGTRNVIHPPTSRDDRVAAAVPNVAAAVKKAPTPIGRPGARAPSVIKAPGTRAEAQVGVTKVVEAGTGKEVEVGKTLEDGLAEGEEAVMAKKKTAKKSVVPKKKAAGRKKAGEGEKEVEEEAIKDAAPGSVNTRPKRKRALMEKAAEVEFDEDEDGDVQMEDVDDSDGDADFEDPKLAGRKKQRSRASSTPAEEDESVEAEEEEEDAEGEDEDESGTPAKKKPKTAKEKLPRKPRVVGKRKATPDPDAPPSIRKPRSKSAGTIAASKTLTTTTENGNEECQLNIEKAKMSDLCRDPKIGRKSKRFEELEKEKEELKKNPHLKKKEEEEDDPNVVPGETPDEKLKRQAAEAEARANASRVRIGPQMRMVNGQLVLDEESLQVDRHERDAVDESQYQIVEETATNRLSNSAAFSKRERVERWDATETDKFFEALSMFGTDFGMIAKMFPERTRRQVKSKFNSEERKNPLRLRNALMNPQAVDMNAYSTLAKMEFPDPAELEAELASMRAEHEAEDAKHAENIAEAEKERRTQADAAMHAELNAQQFGMDLQPKGKKKKGRKNDPGAALEQTIDLSPEEYLEMRRKEEEENTW